MPADERHALVEIDVDRAVVVEVGAATEWPPFPVADPLNVVLRELVGFLSIFISLSFRWLPFASAFTAFEALASGSAAGRADRRSREKSRDSGFIAGARLCRGERKEGAKAGDRNGRGVDGKFEREGSNGANAIGAR
jgi:hypothetical protein